MYQYPYPNIRVHLKLVFVYIFDVYFAVGDGFVQGFDVIVRHNLVKSWIDFQGVQHISHMAPAFIAVLANRGDSLWKKDMFRLMATIKR